MTLSHVATLYPKIVTTLVTVETAAVAPRLDG
jgi:hypothetical protein